MESLIFSIAESLKIPEYLFGFPNFYEQFSNWYFCNFHHWEFIPEDPILQEIVYDSEDESEIEWYISENSTNTIKNNIEDLNIDDLFEESDYLSDTGSDYSLYWYNSD
jgi:hypothetical protein